MNFADDRYDLDEMQSFVVGVESEFYPDFGQLYRRRITAWAAAHRVEDDADDSEAPISHGERS